MPDRLESRRADKSLARFNEGERKLLLGALGTHLPQSRMASLAAFEKVLSKALKAAQQKVTSPIRKAIMSGLSERDEKAEPCTDSHGNPEPDTEMRDHELVPLSENWLDYVEQEVKPFAPDAWVDQS